MFYRNFLRPLLFSLDAEKAHNIVVRALKFLSQFTFLKKTVSNYCYFHHPVLEQSLFGRNFLNPVGLAAGFDKNCEILDILNSFGFGFVECGTITPKPQEGNPKPRIFRLKKELALLNSLGFNNCGTAEAREHLLRNESKIPLGISIGKNAETPNEIASTDYLSVMERLYDFADYFALNVSSPNTPGIRDLQKNLSALLYPLQQKNEELAKLKKLRTKPIFVKISPDLELKDLDRIAEECIANKITGIIATNTKGGLNRTGGLSGKPLEKKATEIVRHLYRNFGKKLILIGVGGIFSAEDAYDRIKAGASLIQIYTGWIYEGPCLTKKINQGLADLLKKDGFKNVQEAVGIEC